MDLNQFSHMKKVFLLVFLSLITSNGYCCECSEKPSIEKNWELADQIFIGKVVKIDSTLYNVYGLKIYSFTINIKQSFKEEVYPNQYYRTILYEDTGACDFIFDVGQEYLVYAKGNDKVLHCSLCSRTDLLKNISKDEIYKLNQLQKEYHRNLQNITETKIYKFRNNIEYQIDLVKDSFKETMERKNLIIYILSGISFLLLLILILVIRKKK